MFNHFRHYYPQGSLVSQFVAVDNHQYIVQVIASVGNVTIASSLAAAATVEQAEDKARERLFALLEIPPTSVTPTNGSVTPTPPQPVTQPQISQPPPPKPKPEPIASSPEPVVSPPSPKSEPIVSSPEPEPVVSPPTPEPEPVVSSPEPEPVVSPPTPEPEPIVSPPEPEPEPVTPSVATPVVDENFDFSETIAQTNIEMKRLSWTKDQGRDYLRETYGKLSRQYLTDQELAEFLEYLRSQPG